MARRTVRTCALGILLVFCCFVLFLFYYPRTAHDATRDETAPWCRVPHYDPMDRSARKIFEGRAPAPVRCRADGISLSRVLDRVLYVDTERLLRFARVKHPLLPQMAPRCCVSDLSRGPPEGPGDPWRDDREFTLGPCRPFFQRAWLSSELVVVRCRIRGEELYRAVHFSVSAGGSKWLEKRRGGGAAKAPSALVLGIDSTSRLNSLRFLTETRARLVEAGAVEMTMYNKVGENTLPNLLPVLAGVSVVDAKSTHPRTDHSPEGLGCWPSRNHTFDRCPFLWRRFSSLGYATMFAEDEPDISTFNYHRAGFGVQPADFYLRPFFLASSRLEPVTTKDGMSVCYGARLTTEILLKYASDFVRWSAGRGIPFFGLVWTSNLSHQSAADVSLADRLVANFVKEAALTRVEGGLLLIVLSDHGMRWGPLRESPSGWQEERMPFLFVRPPGGGKNSLLALNSRRLVSPFDVHATLSALLPGRSSLTSCAHCVDLLAEAVPENRTCEDAAIPEEWCACGEEAGPPAADGKAHRLATLALAAVNRETDPYRASCKPLHVMRVMEVRPKGDSALVRFVATPGGGAFEGRLKRDKEWRVIGGVSRINPYGSSSFCVDDPAVKPYCHCR